MYEIQNMEYKQSWHDEYLKTICAFANTQGGTLFIGKDDSNLKFQEIEEGNLIKLFYEVQAQLDRKFFTKPIEFEGFQRVEKGEYPVTNAVRLRIFLDISILYISPLRGLIFLLSFISINIPPLRGYMCLN
jgi:predicted HTH transcriptional regulator